MPWPTMMPPDLRSAVNRVLGFRNVEAADVWTEVRDWLVAHGVQAPELPHETRPGDIGGSMPDR